MSEYTTHMTSGRQYVTAFFDSRADAEVAITRIAAEGVPQNEIQLIEGNQSGGTVTASGSQHQKGFFEALGDFFMPEEDRHTYAEGLSRGGYFVSLNTTAENRDRIIDILDDEGTVDMDQREESWRSEGWAGYQAAPSTAGAAMTGRNDDAIEVVEEQLHVGKRQVEQGRVRVRSYVVETPVEEQVTLRDETVHLERNPVDRPVSTDTNALFAERTIETTETDEEAVISKDARVTEEVRLVKDVEDRTKTVHDTVRHTEVEVEDDRANRTDRTR